MANTSLGPEHFILLQQSGLKGIWTQKHTGTSTKAEE